MMKKSLNLLGFLSSFSISTLNKEDNGVYVFVLDGKIEIEGTTLSRRDGMGIWETKELSLLAKTDARVLLMEIPMSA